MQFPLNTVKSSIDSLYTVRYNRNKLGIAMHNKNARKELYLGTNINNVIAIKVYPRLHIISSLN